MTTWLVMIGVGLGSYAFRTLPALLLRVSTLSARRERLIRDAGLAAVAALVATSTRVAADGTAGRPALVAVAAALVLAATRQPSTIRLLAFGGAVYAARYAATVCWPDRHVREDRQW